LQHVLAYAPSRPRGHAILFRIARKSSGLGKDAFRRRLEGMEHGNLNPSAGLRASHEWMGDVSTIPEAGRQNPESDKTPSSYASQDSIQPDELERVMSLETALVRALQCLEGK
jgi:hypothetical protein